jgi:hypothetical protein
MGPPLTNEVAAETKMKTSSPAWWIAAVLATMLMGEIGSFLGQSPVSSDAGVTSLELLPRQQWGFGTVREMGLAWGPWGRGGFATRRCRLGFFAVSVQTRSRCVSR